MLELEGTNWKFGEQVYVALYSVPWLLICTNPLLGGFNDGHNIMANNTQST